MDFGKKVSIILLLLFSIGFFIRLFPVKTSYHFWDETIYLQHGEIISGLREDNYNEMDFRPPLLPLILASIFFISHSVISAHIVVSFLASLSILIIFYLAKSFFRDDKAAIISSLIFLMLPLHIKYSHLILTDSLLPTLWSATILLSYLSVRRDKIIYYSITGFLMGLSFLMKFTSLILIPLVFLLIAIMRTDESHLKAFTNSIVNVLKDIKFWLLMASGFITITPYLIFNQIRYGFFLHGIIKQYIVVSWSTKTSEILFFSNFPELFPLIFLTGLIPLLVFYKREGIKKEDLILFIAIIIPFAALQLVEHKEIRFLLPLTPFISILSARGFSKVYEALEKSPKISKSSLIIFISSLLLIGSASIYLQSEHLQGIKESLFWKDSPPIMNASIWLHENTEKNATVYTNYKWPVVAYYSRREIKLLPINGEFQNEIEKFLKGKGYIITSSSSQQPTKEFLMEKDNFTFIREFEGNPEVYIFKYEV